MESFVFFASPFEVLAFTALLAALLYGLGFFKGIYEKKQLLKVTLVDLEEPFWICIPARNEIERLPHTVKTLLKHENPNLRVFVADDGSTDGSDSADAQLWHPIPVDVDWKEQVVWTCQAIRAPIILRKIFLDWKGNMYLLQENPGHFFLCFFCK